MSVLQSVSQIAHLGHPLLVFVDVVLVILDELEDRHETSFLLSQYCLGLGPRTVSCQQFPADLLTQNILLLLLAVAAVHSGHF